LKLFFSFKDGKEFQNERRAQRQGHFKNNFNVLICIFWLSKYENWPPKKKNCGNKDLLNMISCHNILHFVTILIKGFFIVKQCVLLRGNLLLLISSRGFYSKVIYIWQLPKKSFENFLCMPYPTTQIISYCYYNEILTTKINSTAFENL
jgi:hypothetical protein